MRHRFRRGAAAPGGVVSTCWVFSRPGPIAPACGPFDGPMGKPPALDQFGDPAGVRALASGWSGRAMPQHHVHIVRVLYCDNTRRV